MEVQQELLNAHSFFRGIVAPSALNMGRMVSIIAACIIYNINYHMPIGMESRIGRSSSKLLYNVHT